MMRLPGRFYGGWWCGAGRRTEKLERTEESKTIGIGGGGVVRGFEFKGQTTTKQSASRLVVVVGNPQEREGCREVWNKIFDVNGSVGSVMCVLTF